LRSSRTMVAPGKSARSAGCFRSRRRARNRSTGRRRRRSRCSRPGFPLGQQAQPEILDGVGVLVLVHQDVAEHAVVISSTSGWVRRISVIVHQQVAEIAGVHRLQPLLVLGVEAAGPCRWRNRRPRRRSRGPASAAILPALDDRPSGSAASSAWRRYSRPIICLSSRIWSSVSRMVKFAGQPHQLGVPAQHLGASAWKVPSQRSPSAGWPRMAATARASRAPPCW
jgi:hypothetical protein